MRDYLGQLRYRLIEVGCPGKQLRRIVGEVADHREDLIQAGLAEGLPAGEAQTSAERKLGSSLDLAERMAAAQRESTWFGRHFLITFGFLPLVALPLIWALLMYGLLMLGYLVLFGIDPHKLHVMGDNAVLFKQAKDWVRGSDYLALALTAGLVCWLARRWAVSFTWMTIACLVGSVYGICFYTQLARHSYILGFAPHAEWDRAFMPLLVVGILHLNRWRLLWNAKRSPVS